MGILKKIFSPKNNNTRLEETESPSPISFEYTIPQNNRDNDYMDSLRSSEMGLEMRLNQLKHSVNSISELLPADRDNYRLNEDEVILLEEFYKQFKTINKKPLLYVGRTSNGALDMQYKGCPFGRARLQGKKHWLQFYIGLNGKNKIIEGEINDFIPYVEKWVNYINNYL